MKVELTCFLYNKKLADMEIEQEDIPVKVTIDTLQIESVRQRIEDDTDEVDEKS